MRLRVYTILLVTLTGCYAFVPTSETSAPAGRPIQVTLSPEGSVALTPLVGPSVAVIEGRLDRDSAATYVVSVSQTTRRDGAETDWHGERVAVPHALVAQLATRKFSRTRTVAIGAIGTGLLAAITEAFVGGSGASVSGAGSGGVRSGK